MINWRTYLAEFAPQWFKADVKVSAR